MADFTKPSILRLARRAGIKNLSDECYDPIRSLIGLEIEEVIRTAVHLSDIKGTKTMSIDDVHEAIRLLGKNVAKSEDLSVASCNSKK